MGGPALQASSREGPPQGQLQPSASAAAGSAGAAAVAAGGGVTAAATPSQASSSSVGSMFGSLLKLSRYSQKPQSTGALQPAQAQALQPAVGDSSNEGGNGDGPVGPPQPADAPVHRASSDPPPLSLASGSTPNLASLLSPPLTSAAAVTALPVQAAAPPDAAAPAYAPTPPLISPAVSASPAGSPGPGPGPGSDHVECVSGPVRVPLTSRSFVHHMRCSSHVRHLVSVGWGWGWGGARHTVCGCVCAVYVGGPTHGVTCGWVSRCHCLCV